ncbi:outer membrane protein transport protein [Vibrio campbellii]|uniref:outer membrane protein transport protein n=1 Tax=Vibrio campbellii TaxID=680 RepID=UPI0001544AD8|nr:outer membrane protein transport protein [Vibrio campbellii]EDL68233.1 long-chain fatty acid transport protein [Vibrio campbellii HY01]MCC8253481.1 outer membrane protein transport protein [Vibrio campbellii CAIM 333]HDM8229579.1 outer membrane protein transport protein [Vibrio campbellii]
MKTNKTLLSAAVAFGLLSTSSVANAAGFQLAEYSATGLGRAYAGEAAMADNASAQWRNPAMLTYLEGTQVSVGAIYVNPNVDVDGQMHVGGGTTLPASSHDFAHDAVIPNFYLSHQYNDKFAIGLAFGTNYGMETDLGKDFAAANFGNEASVMSMEANLNAAYKLNEALSIGGGIRYIIADGSIGAVMPPQMGLVKPTLPGQTLKYMEGDDTAWGWQVGAAWQINDNNRLGFAYKSAVDLTLEGHANGLAFNPMNPNAKKAGSMDLTLPATAELASFHQLNDQLAVHASINWTDWSSFKELVADFPDKSDLIKSENWEDNYRFAVGTTYKLDQKWTLRSGVAYDMSAVDDKYRTTTIPETDRLWLSVGAGYEWSKNLTLDAGFTYIFAKDASISEPRDASDKEAALLGGAFTGEVTGNVWLIGVQANYTF